ncbi:MAG: class GN sortase [Chromatiales bacterium]
MRLQSLQRNWLVAALFGLGLLFAVQGSWIQAKALLSQWLLQHSWQQSLADGERHKPWPWADHWPVARLRVASQNVDQIVLAGDTGNVLAFAPGYNPLSHKPGAGGTTVISAHRDTHFRFLQQIRPGEQISVQTVGGDFVYQVAELAVVDAGNSMLQLHETADQLLLVTCYPFDALQAGGNLRFVVIANRVRQLQEVNRRVVHL